MTTLKTIEMMYLDMDIDDDSQESEFWEFILLLNGLKPGFLPQHLNDNQLQDGLTLAIDSGEIDDDEFGITSFLIQDSDISNEYINEITYETWSSLDNLFNIMENKNVNKENFIGFLLGYECPGDYASPSVTFVKIFLKPSLIFNDIFGTSSEIILSSYACSTLRVNSVKPNVSNYIDKLNLFFSVLDLGTVYVSYVKRLNE
jgi:hypothetical protein